MLRRRKAADGHRGHGLNRPFGCCKTFRRQWGVFRKIIRPICERVLESTYEATPKPCTHLKKTTASLLLRLRMAVTNFRRTIFLDSTDLCHRRTHVSRHRDEQCMSRKGIA